MALAMALAVGREGRGLGREPEGFAELHRRAVIAGSSARSNPRFTNRQNAAELSIRLLQKRQSERCRTVNR